MSMLINGSNTHRIVVWLSSLGSFLFIHVAKTFASVTLDTCAIGVKFKATTNNSECAKLLFGTQPSKVLGAITYSTLVSM